MVTVVVLFACSTTRCVLPFDIFLHLTQTVSGAGSGDKLSCRSSTNSTVRFCRPVSPSGQKFCAARLLAGHWCAHAPHLLSVSMLNMCRFASSGTVVEPSGRLHVSSELSTGVRNSSAHSN